jgi:putative redox protein
MKATINWNGNLNFTASADSGYPVSLDGDRSTGGEVRGASPMELFAMGLGGCTAMDVISVLQKKRQDVTQFEVKVDVDRASEHPKVFTRAAVTYVICGHDVEEAAVLRAMELSATRYCPAQAMFEQVFPIDLRYEIYNDDGDGGKYLIHQGIMQDLAPE